MKYHWSAVGHLRQKRFLERALEKGRLAQVYIFLGPSHIGKTTLACDFARILRCDSGNRPCGRCSSCREAPGLSPDFYFLDQTEPITVDQIRALKAKFSLRSFSSNRKKLAVIANAESLEAPGANAFLKILEEPSADAVFILCCSKAGSLPPTILSRGQKIIFTVVPENEMSEWLGSFGKDQRTALASAAIYGRPGLIKRLSGDQDFYQLWQERERVFRKLMDTSGLEKIGFLSALAELETADLEKALEQWLLLLDGKLSLPESYIGVGKSLEMLKAVSEALQNLRHNVNKRLILDNLFLAV